MNLVNRLINGEEPAFRETFYQLYPGLLRFAKSYIHNSYLAENIVQDAFIILWEKKQFLDTHSNIRAFLVTVVKNKAINLLEKEKNRAEIDSDLLKIRERNYELDALNSLNPEKLFTDEILEILKHALNELPEQTKNIFILSRFQRLSNKSIAEKLDITEKGVEYHISKSLKLLRIKLADYLHILIPILYL